MSPNDFKLKDVLNATVIVAALGYFVDVYDLVLFLIIGGTSLQELGISSENSIPDFQYLLDIQMIGMLVGGVFWGILGDKKGRLSVLFGSIILYSFANVANGLVAELASATGTPVLTMYSILRFIAGFGLAGELGAGITLVSEIMDKKTRGFGTMIIASVGVTGAVVAGLVGKMGWELAYFIGGALGFSLLLLRIGVMESGMFKNINHQHINSILIGLLVWFIIGILIGSAPLFASFLHVTGKIDKGFCIIMCYSGLAFGDVASGLLSQILRSRRKALLIFYGLCLIFVLIYLNLDKVSSSTTVFYSIIFCMGFSVGFWAVFVSMASEQFGTNLRATVTTTVPNFVRGSLVLIALFFDTLVKSYTLVSAAYIVTLVILAISCTSLFLLKETFGKDLDYLEE
jgi:MFS transporter, putative metabolite:H+ symporter